MSVLTATAIGLTAIGYPLGEMAARQIFDPAGEYPKSTISRTLADVYLTVKNHGPDIDDVPPIGGARHPDEPHGYDLVYLDLDKFMSQARLTKQITTST